MKRAGGHRPPPWYKPLPVVLDEQYENQVRRSTEKIELAYRRAQKRVHQAQTRLARATEAPSGRQKKRQVAELHAQLELRRAELEEYRRMMVAVPASATHRGTKSFRPTPPPNA